MFLICQRSNIKTSGVMADLNLSNLDISKLKVPDLRRALKVRGLSTIGYKTDLVDRLQASLASSNLPNDSLIDDIEEDLLNDDDDEHIERDSLINDLDALDDLPKPEKRKSDGNEINEPPKKVVLKRNTSETIAQKEAKVDEEPKLAVEEDIEKKVVKLSELSVKERLEMRAKKFGVTNLNDDAKKLARAERFGTKSSTNNAESIKLNNTAPSIDVLKQRAERFGGSVSTVLSKLEVDEKKEKRKERFGLTNGKSSVGSEAAKAARLERFKTGKISFVL